MEMVRAPALRRNRGRVGALGQALPIARAGLLSGVARRPGGQGQVKLITVPVADFIAANEKPMTVAEWMVWLRKYGIEPQKVLRSYFTDDQKSTVYECEE